MAILDKTQGHLVLRIVYTGPAHSGKTETVRHLAQLLLGKALDDVVYSPSEAKGRTLFFDWFDYQGGIFHDYKIRCQIVTTPGQDLLRARRTQLLADADAAILVIDSDEKDLSSARGHFDELCDTLARQDYPAALLVQANKQDIDTAHYPDEIRQRLSIAEQIPILPSTAIESLGIRETFIKAVGLAVAEADNLFQQQLLPTGQPDVDSGDDLLALIHNQEQALQQDASSTKEPLVEQRHIEIPSFSASHLAAGFVWPPLAGRQLFRQLQTLNPSIESCGEERWQSHFEHWQLQSQAVFAQGLAAKRHWIEALKQYNRLLPQLAPDCAVFLLKAETGDWWLWHITHSGESLVEKIQLILYQNNPSEVAAQLLEYSRLFLELYDVFSKAKATYLLDLEHLSVGDKGLYFHGFLDLHTENAAHDALDFWHQQLRTYVPIDNDLPLDVPQTLNALTQNEGEAAVVEVLSAWLIGE